MTDAGLPRFYLDTTLFIGAFDGFDVEARHLHDVFSVFQDRPLRAVTSEFTLAEVLGKESPKSWAVQTRFFLDLIVWSKFIDLIPVSRDVLLDTGEWRRVVVRTGRSITLPDAIHVMTARRAQCRYVFSSDVRLSVPAPLQKLDPHSLKTVDIEALLDA